MNGKRVKDLLYVLCTLCAAWGWWGAVYPQFTLLDGTYNVVWEKPEEVPGVWRESGDLYWQILSADSSRIRLKSRLWENWNVLKEGRK